MFFDICRVIAYIKKAPLNVVFIKGGYSAKGKSVSSGDGEHRDGGL